MKKIIFMVLVGAASTKTQISYGQDSTAASKKLALQTFSLQTGGFFSTTKHSSPFLQKELTKGTSYYDSFNWNENTYSLSRFSNLSVQADFGFAFKQKNSGPSHSEFRLGVSYNRSYLMSYNHSVNGETFFVDTLVANNSGEKFVLDSTSYNNLYVDDRADYLGVNLGYLYRINPKDRLTFYTGIESSFSLGLTSKTFVNERKYTHWTLSSTSSDNFAYGYQFSIPGLGTHEETSFKPTFQMSFALSLGAEFQLAKKGKLSDFSLTGELTPQLFVYPRGGVVETYFGLNKKIGINYRF